MKFITLLILLLQLSHWAGAQSSLQPIKGQVLNEKTGEPIGWVNIGIPEKYMGTAGDDEGFFILTLPTGTEADTLQISAIGFKTKRYKVSEFKKRSNKNVFLQPRTYSLNTITVTDEKDLKTTWIGKTIRPILSAAYGRSYSGKNIRATYAFKVQWDKSLPLRILHTRMYLKENRSDESVKLRCRIKSVDSKTGLPGDDLMDHNITGSAKDRGWVTCDFVDKDIYIDEASFFVVFEWLSDSHTSSDQSVAAMFAIGVFFDSEVYVRDEVLGRWQKTPNDLIYSVKVEY